LSPKLLTSDLRNELRPRNTLHGWSIIILKQIYNTADGTILKIDMTSYFRNDIWQPDATYGYSDMMEIVTESRIPIMADVVSAKQK